MKTEEVETLTGGGATSTSTTETATASWATQTSGAMVGYSDENTVVVVHTDPGLDYFCPDEGDEWTTEDLEDELTAHTATGVGCSVSYPFTGDSIQICEDAGVFGCEVDLTKDVDSTGWWNGNGVVDTFKPYVGLCRIQGIGYDQHTIRLYNSPHEPQKVYFTGLRYATNKTQSRWEDPEWEACCGAYTFPDGVETALPIASTSSSSSSSSSSTAGSGTGSSSAASEMAGGGSESGAGADAGLSSSTYLALGIGAGVIVALLVVVGFVCGNRKHGSAAAPVVEGGASAGGEAARSLRKTRRYRDESASSDSASSGSGSDESSDEDGGRGRRRR
ncbi:hypothetical protein JCM6882_007641 [Rhodosporidiobolus microsporus]